MCKAKILSNLKGRVNFVSSFCATHGLDNGIKELMELVGEGKVEEQRMRVGIRDKRGNQLPPIPMYRAYPNLDNIQLVK